MSTIAFYLHLSILIAGLSLSMAIEKWCESEASNSSDSGVDDVLPLQNRSTQCVSVDIVKDIGLLHGECTRYLTNRCYLYTSNQTDFNLTIRTIDAVVVAVESMARRGRKQTMRECGNVFLGLVCNSLYPGCHSNSNVPIGLCRDTCLEYLRAEACSSFFADVYDALNESEGEVINLKHYAHCNKSDIFIAGSNTSNATDVKCYRDIKGVADVENATGPNMSTEEGMMGGDEEKTRDKASNTDDVGLNYVLPTITTVLGVTMVTVALLISACYLWKLKKRSQRVGVATHRNSTSHADAFPSLTRGEEIYANCYTLPRFVEGTSPPSSGDGSREIEPTVLPAITTSTNTTTTASSGASAAENVALFQLELSDWAAVGEGVLISFENITITGNLGEGAFGYVVKGLLKEKRTNGHEYHIPVAMKTLKNCASYDEMRGLLLESTLMHSFSHSHILSLRGLSLNPQSGAPYLVMPFMEHGDLRKFLRKKADMTDGSTSLTTYPQGLTHELLARMCCDVAKGMEYLAEKRLVHRDLAARNCMVDRSLRVKVADFGLTREIYEQDCYRQSSHGQLPIKWMSPESLAYRISNEKTDVWSFGVTCWEVFSLGKVPYPTIDNRDLLDYLECGRRLSKPRLCNQHLYDLMELCWNMEPDERPTFSKLVTLLSEPTELSHEAIVSPLGTPSHTLTAQRQRSKVTGVGTECKTGPSADGEYVDMTCCHDDTHDTLVVENCCIERVESETPKVAPKYFNVTILDASGASITMNTAPQLTEIEGTTHQDNRETLILANSSVATVQTRGEESGGDKNEDSISSGGTKETSDSNSATATADEGDGGLLGSIIRHIREKTGAATLEENPVTDRDSGHFVALQMRQLESYKSTNRCDVVKTSTMTSSLGHRNHTHSLRHSIIQRASKFTPSVESVPEACDQTNSHQSLYEECPTTPHVTIAFNTGERVTPVAKMFAFSSDHLERTNRISREVNCGDESSTGNKVSRDIYERERGERKRSSMPGGSSVLENGGLRGGGMRERFFSYSAGDYVKMHPANPL